MNRHLLDHAHRFGLVTAENVFLLVKELIEQAEIIYSSKSGKAKRSAVLEVCRLIIEELPESENKTKLLALMSGPIPDAIDLAVAVANSTMFNSCWKSIRRYFRRCKCSCC